MPMPTRIATASVVATTSPFTRVITSASNLQAGNTLSNQPALYGVYWQMICTAGGSAAGTTYPPLFTWYDASISAGVTATASPWSTLFGGLATANILGTGVTSMGVSGVVSGRLAGVEYFQCGSGASGASAYIQYAITGNVGGGSHRLDLQLFQVDLWGV